MITEVDMHFTLETVRDYGDGCPGRIVTQHVTEQRAYEVAFMCAVGFTTPNLFVWIYCSERVAPGVLYAKRVDGEWKGYTT